MSHIAHQRRREIRVIGLTNFKFLMGAAALANTERMASILTTLLEERIVDTGKGSTLSIPRQDADDIRFAAEQLLTMLARR